MNEPNTDSQPIMGRKVFFVNPNLTIFPEIFCADYMALGFECYFLIKDSLISLEDKIDVLVKLYKDIILYFFIDSPDPKPGVSWLQFIKSLNKKYDNPLSIGILYSKRPSQQDAEQTSFLYENEARATCGAFMLEFNKRKNFNIILQALVTNGAIGRRKNVRVICPANCKIRFNYNHTDFFISLTDMSMSHFTGTFDLGSLPVAVNDKLFDIEFNIKGLHFSHSASVLFKRIIGPDKELLVFAFMNKNEQLGLDPTVKEFLLEKLYALLLENFSRQFDKAYEERQKELRSRVAGRAGV